MCTYCERRKDVKYGWEQPSLYNKSKNAPFGDNLHSNIGNDWKARIHDHQTATPELIITSKDLAGYLWNNGVASLYLPIKYCPICGRKLGKTEKSEACETVHKYTLKEGSLVQHFKRQYCNEIQKKHGMHLYKIMGKAINTETEETMIVYQAMYPPYKAFACPEIMFYQKVDKAKYSDSIQVCKFVPYFDKIPSNPEKLKLAIKKAGKDVALGDTSALIKIIPDIESTLLNNPYLALDKIMDDVTAAFISASDTLIDEYLTAKGE